MDWRHNQWVGVGAAVLLVLAIVGIFLYVGGGSTPVTGVVEDVMTYRCQATGETFAIPGKDFQKRDVYLTYFDRPGEDLPCKIDGNDDARWVYWCEECQKYYDATRAVAGAEYPRCPEGHNVTIWGAEK